MKRKDFLRTSIMAAFSVSTVGNLFQTAKGDFKGDCQTTNDILGPFYRPKAPIRNDLLFRGVKGNVINIEGSVFGEDCRTPISDALIEIWHCGVDGAYDNESEGFNYRARWETDKKGAYEFKTIFPGKYLNGRFYRPAHIHFRVRAKGFQELISQIYFEGDPHIEKDPWASSPKASQRILNVVPAGVAGGFTVYFDIYLAKE